MIRVQNTAYRIGGAAFDAAVLTHNLMMGPEVYCGNAHNQRPEGWMTRGSSPPVLVCQLDVETCWVLTGVSSR